jgi:hypothetical protein
VSNLKRPFPATPNQHRSVLRGSEVPADVPVIPANSPTMDVTPRESSNCSSLGIKHKAAPPCLKLPPRSRLLPRDRKDVTFFLKARSRNIPRPHCSRIYRIVTKLNQGRRIRKPLNLEHRLQRSGLMVPKGKGLGYPAIEAAPRRRTDSQGKSASAGPAGTPILAPRSPAMTSLPRDKPPPRNTLPKANFAPKIN